MKKYFLLCIVAWLFASCRATTNPNEWVVSTATCWNTMSVLKAGKPLPKLLTKCDRYIILPATELSAEFEVGTKFAHRLAANIECAYQWKITDPIEFVGSAKSLVSSDTSDDRKVDPDKLESIENAVVDKMLMDIIRAYTPNVEARDIDEATIERELQVLVDSSFAERGVAFMNMSIDVTLSQQAEEALDVMSALRFYKANGE